MDIWDDDIWSDDGLAIDVDEAGQIEAENEKRNQEALENAMNRKNARTTQAMTNATSAPAQEVSEPAVQPTSEPEPEVSEPDGFFDDEPVEPEETPVAVQPAPAPEPEPEHKTGSIWNDDFFGDDVDEPKEPPVAVQPTPTPVPEPEPKVLEPDFFDDGTEETSVEEPKTADLDELFNDDDDEPSAFSSVIMPSAPPPAPVKPSAPAKPSTSVMNPDSVVIPEKVEEADISDLLGGEETNETLTTLLPEDNLVFNDPDKMEMSPAELAIYARIPQKSGHTQPMEWLTKMKNAMPSPEILQQMITNWISEKSEPFNILKLPSLREAKNWKISDILQDEQVFRELCGRSSAIWKETLLQSQGNESLSWLEKVWFTKLLQYAVNYFMICMK